MAVYILIVGGLFITAWFFYKRWKKAREVACRETHAIQRQIDNNW